MGFERGGNYKNQKSFQVTYSIRVKYLFNLRVMSSGGCWNITFRCGIHNHYLAKGLMNL